MLKLTRLTLLAGGLLLAALSAFAQSNATGRISGAVVSSDNQALPGVTVSLFSPALQGVRTATTSANGDYIFTFLPAGDYEVAFDLTGFQGVKQRVRVALAENVPLNATLGVATVQESLVVEAEAGSGDFAQTAPVASSYKQELVDKLPIDRTLDKIALLSPGVQATGPAVGSGARATAGIVISGANSFDSLFLINGVVVNENLRGQSLDLFIEDAIQETTTTTAAVSAEFGRFAGGVVQAVTKSGGNLWNGSFRVTFDNDSWRDTTPFGEPKLDKTVPRYEATVGGPILRDRLWLFGAARLVNDEVANQTRFTNIAYTQPDRERRYEGKLTYSINANHSVKGSYTKITRDRQNTAFSTIMDEASLYDRSDPQDLLSLNYTGILSSKFFVEGQYSRRRLTFEGSGSRFTDLIKGTLLLDRQRNSARYNAPTFCAVCGPPETRDNDDILVKATYFLSTKGAGSHTLVAGFDTFADKRFANNHQSGSDYRIFGTTSIIRGTEIFPVFNNDTTTFIRWNPIFTESEGNVFRTNSAFLNDTWRLGNKLTFNLGVRFDQNDGQDAAGATVVKDSAFSPRLAVTYDPTGDGLWTLNAGYGKYVAGLNNAQGDSATAGGNPSRIDFNYLGPAINTNPNAPLLTSAQALEALFNWFNSNGGTSRPVRGTTDVSGVNAGIGDRLASPHAREVTLGVTRRLGNRGLVRLDGVYREFRDFYSNRTDRSTGQVTDPRFGRRLDFTVVENTNEESRRYKGPERPGQLPRDRPAAPVRQLHAFPDPGDVRRGEPHERLPRLPARQLPGVHRTPVEHAGGRPLQRPPSPGAAVGHLRPAPPHPGGPHELGCPAVHRLRPALRRAGPGRPGGFRDQPGLRYAARAGGLLLHRPRRLPDRERQADGREPQLRLQAQVARRALLPGHGPQSVQRHGGRRQQHEPHQPVRAQPGELRGLPGLQPVHDHARAGRPLGPRHECPARWSHCELRRADLTRRVPIPADVQLLGGIALLAVCRDTSGRAPGPPGPGALRSSPRIGDKCEGALP